MRTAPVRLFCATLAASALHLGAPDVGAQVAVPPQGEGSMTVTYQNYHHTGHFDREGKKNKNGATQSQILIALIDVGVTDAIGLSVSLPFIASKYTGPPFYFVEGIRTEPGPLDDRTYHASFQDVRVEARRLFVAGPVALAPFVSVSLPTHEYETVGESVPGRRRRELQVGVGASSTLDAFLPRTYVHGRYAYATLERVNGFPHTRSNIEIEAGYDLISRLGVRGFMGVQIAHKRPTIAQLVPDWVNHDRFINSSYLNVGAGASWSLTRSTEISVDFAGTIRGNRGAHVARILAIGVTRSFGGGFSGLGG